MSFSKLSWSLLSLILVGFPSYSNRPVLFTDVFSFSFWEAFISFPYFTFWDVLRSEKSSFKQVFMSSNFEFWEVLIKSGFGLCVERIKLSPKCCCWAYCWWPKSGDLTLSTLLVLIVSKFLFYWVFKFTSKAVMPDLNWSKLGFWLFFKFSNKDLYWFMIPSISALNAFRWIKSSSSWAV